MFWICGSCNWFCFVCRTMVFVVIGRMVRVGDYCMLGVVQLLL